MVGASCIEAMEFTRCQAFNFRRRQATEEGVKHGSNPQRKGDVSKGVNRIKRETLPQQDKELCHREVRCDERKRCDKTEQRCGEGCEETQTR